MLKKIIKNLIPLSIIIAGIIIAGAIVFINENKADNLSSQKVAEIVVKYINQDILKGEEEASLLDVIEENGVYKIKLKIENQEIDLYATKNGKFLFLQAVDLKKTSALQPEEDQYTIGNFLVSKDEICKENEKPIVYFFGLESCPHCRWEHPIVENVASEFKENISFHNNMDSNQDIDVFSKYSSGSVPTLVLGCKYYRIGSGETIGEEQELKILTALICKLTENKPVDICNEVKDLINQVNE